MTHPYDLALDDLHGALSDPVMTSMNFLNEVAERYPEAISFAAGRPTESFFRIEELGAHLDRFAAHLRSDRGMTEQEAARILLRYGPTKGVIAHLVRDHLALDEGIDVPAEAVVVTAGCQNFDP